MSVPIRTLKKVYVLVASDFNGADAVATQIVGVYATKEAVDTAETAFNRKHPFASIVDIEEHHIRGLKTVG